MAPARNRKLRVRWTGTGCDRVKNNYFADGAIVAALAVAAWLLNMRVISSMAALAALCLIVWGILNHIAPIPEKN